MYVKVMYGNNEEMLVNPDSMVINLLKSIKRRVGFGANPNMLVDLSDESGLVKELDTHRYDPATKHLASHATYILVEKQPLPKESEAEDPGSPGPTRYMYTSLLDNAADLYPCFRVHVTEVAPVRKTRKTKLTEKSPSPAGVKAAPGVKAKTTKRTNKKK